jgi:S1-C subfamily serine protease
MNDTDLPATASHDAPRGEPSGPSGPRHTRRGRLLVALAALAVVAALLAAFGAGRLSGKSNLTAAPTTPSRPSVPSSATRPARSLPASAVAAKVDPGLVNINVAFGYSGARGSATGMVLTPSGEVLTNNHVVLGTTKISVTDIGNGRTYSASVVGYDRTSDIAVLQLQGASGLPTVPLGDSSLVALNDRVTALGNAGGGGGTPRLARGLVTALSQSITATDPGGGNAQRLQNLIETNAPIRPGDSGGALANAAGQVIGMNAASSAGFDTRPSNTQGYAIPIDQAIAISNQIEAGKASSTVHIGPTGFLGVEIVPPSQLGGAGSSGTPQTGALLGGVLSGFPAQKAGLSQGDVIMAVNGQTVTSATALNSLLSTHHPGDTVQVRWLDPSGQTHTANIKLASGPPA